MSGDSIETMADNWRNVRRTLSPEREARIKNRAETEIHGLPLVELRKARMMTRNRLFLIEPCHDAGHLRLRLMNGHIGTEPGQQDIVPKCAG